MPLSPYTDARLPNIGAPSTRIAVYAPGKPLMLMLLVKHTPHDTTSCTPLTSEMLSTRLVGDELRSRKREVITSTFTGESRTKVSFIVPVTTTSCKAHWVGSNSIGPRETSVPPCNSTGCSCAR